MDNRMHRREFLQGMGVVVGGALIIGPNLAGCTGLDDDVTSVGVYVPQDSTVGERFAAGLTVARRVQSADGAPMRLVVSDFEGLRPSASALDAQIEAHNLDAVVALMNARAADPLLEVLRRTKTPLVVATAGAELMSAEAAECPWLYVASLGAWEASYAAGRHLARRHGTPVVIAAATKEAGYDETFAFCRGFEEATDAAPILEFTNPPSAPRTLDEALEAIAAHRPKAVYGLMSGEEAVAFAGAFRRHDTLSRVPLVGGSFFAAQARPNERFTGWSPVRGSARSKEFERAYRRAVGDRPDAFALLGGEAHTWLSGALAASGPRGGRAEALAEALASADVDGLRGRCCADADSGRLVAPVYRERRSGAVESIAVATDLQERLFSVLQGTRSGVLSPYLVG